METPWLWLFTRNIWRSTSSDQSESEAKKTKLSNLHRLKLNVTKVIERCPPLAPVQKCSLLTPQKTELPKFYVELVSRAEQCCSVSSNTRRSAEPELAVCDMAGTCPAAVGPLSIRIQWTLVVPTLGSPYLWFVLLGHWHRIIRSM